MIEKMNRCSFVLLSGDEEKFLKDLQDLGMVDITRSSKPVDDKSAALLSKVESIKRALEWFKGSDYSQDRDFKQINAYVIGTVSDPLKETADNISVLEETSAALSDAYAEREARLHWGRFDAQAIADLEKNGLKMRFYTVRAKDFDPGWASLYSLTEVSRDADKVWFVTISDDPDYSFPIDEVPAPSGDYTVSDQQIAILEKKLLDCKCRLHSLKRDYTHVLEKDCSQLLSEVDRYLASVASTRTADGHLVVMEGFVPQDCAEKVQSALDRMPVVCLQSAATVEDNPPISLKNNRFVKMFDILTDMYGMPAYDEFDPTAFISIFFTLFFAFCMGDAGYGLVIILAGLLLRKSSMRSISPLVLTLGAATTVIGFFFHSFFSVDISQWGFIQSLGLNKIMVPGDKVEVPGMGAYDWNMMLALVCGVLHIALAQTVKAIVATRNKGFKDSLGVWGWTILIVGAVAIGAFALAGVMNKEAAKIAIIVVGIISGLFIFFLRDLHKSPLFNFGNGLWETYNTATGLLSDVLSYLRLYALGLAGSLLGDAFNDLGVMVRGDGGAGWIFFLFLVIVGHVLNIAMSGLSAFVHPLRLNFLEFFKNAGYSGTGQKYNPLKEETI